MNEVDTPLMSQYKEIKKEHENNILFFRLGDFYEMFFDDAKLASKELGLTLTKRNKEKGKEIPLAGVPYHSAPTYIAKLIQKGYSVAICDQVEDPKLAKGIVKREVTRIITPGTVIDANFLDEKQNNYLMCIVVSNDIAGVAYADITTGEFRTTEFYSENIIYKILGEINKVSPSELIMDEKTYENCFESLDKYNISQNITINKVKEVKDHEKYLIDYFKVMSLESFGLKKKLLASKATAQVLSYIENLQKGKELPFSKVSFNLNDDIMDLNYTTQKNLEIMSENKETPKSGTLLGILDNCKTAMGSRLLKKIIKNPLLDIEKIKERQSHIEFFIDNILKREDAREKLKDIYDVERITSRLILDTENGKDLLAIKESIKNSLEIAKILDGNSIFTLDIESLNEIYKTIEKTISHDAPFSIREGGIIKDGYNKELDELRVLSKHGKDFLIELEEREREKTGIKGLKIKYNKVFGYFIEVTKANEHLVPKDYIRKQTLVNCERYIVEELKEYEEKIITAKSKIESLEYYLFKEITTHIKKYKESLIDLANKLSFLDVITNLAQIAVENLYIRPEIVEGGDIEIRGGRHPIVEKLISYGEFVKNDTEFNEEKKLIILTGPNMSGKSTYMKQIALIIIMAQIGSFVPADYAKISIADKIFTRIGASDDLLTGQSTFMLEMSEVANIVNNATSKSFIILDEIGRGTSTFDGISIATSITEYIHDKIKAKTIFATHYHELTELEKKLKNAVNFRIEVIEKGNKVLFLRKIVQGGADKSYGIEVARLSGIPKQVLNRAKTILKKLENRKAIIDKSVDVTQLSLFDAEGLTNEISELTDEVEKTSFENLNNRLDRGDNIGDNIVDNIIKELKVINLYNMTPMDALIKLNELVELIKKEEYE